MTMKITRRNFIASVVGGVVGIQVTPLPWKITDDAAIWTQNWPWVPVPATGEVTEENTVCNLCPGGCGISVRKVSERAVKIEGRTDYPINPGGICPVGMGGLQLLYDNDMRFPGPMKRAGARGSGQFVKITWGEAYDILAGRIADLRKAGKPEALATIDGNVAGTTTSLLIERFMQAVGSPNYVRPATITDTYNMGNQLMVGKAGPMAYDLENSDFVLSFGCGLLEGWGAPGRVMNTWSMWHDANPAKRKAKVVQVESRASNTASKADFWVTPRPGTDGALALGIVHVLISKGRVDGRFINGSTYGFEDFTDSDGRNQAGFKSTVLKKYSPAQVEEITGVDAKTVIALADSFGKAKAPVAIYGKGKNNLNGSLYEFMAVQSLNAVAGRINRPGGVLLPDALPLSPLPDFDPDEVAAEGLKRERLDGAGTTAYPFSQSLINNFADAINQSEASPIDTLLVFSANPFFTVPDGGGFKNALEKIPFIVSFSPYRDDTATMADLILPDHNYLEKMEDTVWPVGLQYPFYGLSRPVVEPVNKTRNTGDVVISLSKAVGEETGNAFPWENFEEVLEARAKGLFDAGGGLVRYDPEKPPWKFKPFGNGQKPDYKSFDDMWEEMKSGGMWFQPVKLAVSQQGLFATPSGKFEFVSQELLQTISGNPKGTKGALKQMGIRVSGVEAAMAHYEAPRLGADRSKYPLFMVPYEMINLAGGWIPTPPFLYKTIFAGSAFEKGILCSRQSGRPPPSTNFDREIWHSVASPDGESCRLAYSF
jgi:anaerobic selenocysteine-containing dehydrogenase